MEDTQDPQGDEIRERLSNIDYEFESLEQFEAVFEDRDPFEFL